MGNASGDRRLLRPLAVFAWLGALTLFELGVVALPLPRSATIALLVGSALAKASFVGLFFMHLRIERPWIHAIAFLPLLLAALFVLGLVPDIGLRASGAGP